MKKLFLTLVMVLFCGLSITNVVYAEDTDKITSPEQVSPNRYPHSGDTYFTYYSEITGYKSNGLWGFYSKNNNSVNIPPMYSEIEGLNSEYIKVKRNGQWGLINTDGYQLLPTKYDNIETFGYSDDNFLVKYNGYCGVVDKDGREIVPIKYQSIYRLNDSYMKVSQNYKYGIFSVKDKDVIISISYDDVALLDSYFKVKFGGKWGLLDRYQNTIVPAKYDDIKALSTVFFAVKNNKVWGTVDKTTGEEVIAPKYDKIEFGKSNYLKVKHGGKWGATTMEGKVVIPITKGPFEINKELKKLY